MIKNLKMAQTKKSSTKPDGLGEMYYTKTKYGFYHFSYEPNQYSIGLFADLLFGGKKGLFIYFSDENIFMYYSNDKREDMVLSLDAVSDTQTLLSTINNIVKFSIQSLESQTIYYYVENRKNEEEVLDNLLVDIREKYKTENIRYNKTAEKIANSLEPLSSNAQKITFGAIVILPIVIAFFLSSNLQESFLEQKNEEYNVATNQIDTEIRDNKAQTEVIKAEFEKYKYLTTVEDIDKYIEEVLKKKNKTMRRY